MGRVELGGDAVHPDGAVKGALLEDGPVEDLGQREVEVDPHVVFVDHHLAPRLAVAPRPDVVGIAGVDGALLVDPVVDAPPVGGEQRREIGGELEARRGPAVVDVGAEIKGQIGPDFPELSRHVTDHVVIDPVGDVDVGGKGIQIPFFRLVVEFGALLALAPAEAVVGVKRHGVQFGILLDVGDHVLDDLGPDTGVGGAELLAQEQGVLVGLGLDADPVDLGKVLRMGLVVLLRRDPVVEVVVAALDLDAPDPEGFPPLMIQSVVILHPDVEEVELVLGHPVGQLGRIVVEGVLLDEAPDLEGDLPGGDETAGRQLHRPLPLEDIPAGLEEEVPEELFREVVDAVKDLHGRGPRHGERVPRRADLERGEFLVYLEVRLPGAGRAETSERKSAKLLRGEDHGGIRKRAREHGRAVDQHFFISFGFPNFSLEHFLRTAAAEPARTPRRRRCGQDYGASA